MKKMKFLSCDFVKAIDFTAVPQTSKPILGVPPKGIGDAPPPAEDRPLGLKNLQTLIHEIYAAKRKDDLKSDQAPQPRRQLCPVLQEFMRRKHGVRHVVHQKSWQLVESLLEHRSKDKTVSLFTDFLDGSRDTDELSFYAYCVDLVTHTVHEDMAPACPVPKGRVSLPRALRTAELLFGDLPKTHVVLKMELEKSARVEEQDPYSMFSFDMMQLFDMHSFTPDVEQTKTVLADELFELLLEGWRMSSLLLEAETSKTGWRQCVLAFIRSDDQKRGWLNPLEVTEGEERWLQIPADPSFTTPIPDRTSLGGFVHRIIKRRSFLAESPDAKPMKKGRMRLGKAMLKERQNCLKVTQNAFKSIEKSLAVYLTGLMHSEELKDVALYRSLKTWLFGYRQALNSEDALAGTHNLRCLVLLLLAHQVDFQSSQQMLNARRLDAELRSMLQVLQVNWQARNELGGSDEDGTMDEEAHEIGFDY